MIDPMTLLVLLILACWVLREVCGLLVSRERKVRGGK